MNQFLWEETIPGGNHWSGVLRRGTALRLTDLEGGANVAALLYNREEKLERYNMPDTLKAQHTAFLTAGNVCYSDMGRILCSVIGDSLGWHDTICGVSDIALVVDKYLPATFQTHRNGMVRNGKDSLLIELGKWGLGKRDLVANINFFSKVTVDEAGGLCFHADHSPAGATVDLRFDMDVLVALSTAPHPLDHKKEYRPASVKLSAWHVGEAPSNDICRISCAQNQRGFINTERYYAR
jgi:urea carboxylase-associated protein 2